MSLHQVTPAELAAVSALGFAIDHTSKLPAEDFIKLHFAGFDLLGFAQEIENHLQPISEDVIQRNIVLKDEVPPRIEFIYITVNIADADHRLLFKRTFTKETDSLNVNHDFLSLPQAARGKRLGRKILQICLQRYLAMGVKKVNVHAALETGGYEWTKAGFRATRPIEMVKILSDAKLTLNAVQYSFVEALYNDYYGSNPGGAAFPIMEWSGLPFMKEILKRNDWHGEIDLSNSEDLFNFSEYVNG